MKLRQSQWTVVGHAFNRAGKADAALSVPRMHEGGFPNRKGAHREGGKINAEELKAYKIYHWSKKKRKGK